MSNKSKENIEIIDTEKEISIWDIVMIIVQNWKIVLIITFCIALLGSVYGLSVNDDVEYVFRQQVIYDKYNYYPMDFISNYQLALNKYIDENYEKSGSISVSFDVDKGDIYYLTLNYNGFTYEEANAVTEDIVNRHNQLMYDEFIRRIALKQEQVDTAYTAYIESQNKYHEFMYGTDGYYDVENSLNRYQRYVKSYQAQLEQFQTMLLKVESGVPLLLEDIFLDEGMPIEYYQRDEIIQNHYSAEKLQMEIEFIESELESCQKIYDEYSTLLNEMTISEVTLMADRDITKEYWIKRENEMSTLTYNLSRIGEYYVGNTMLTEKSGYGFVVLTAVAAVLGFVISILFIFIKASYQSYKKKKGLN